MIREFKENDINEIIKIWLDVNIEAHSFIEKEHWQRNYDEVKKALFHANVYVYTDNDKIIGFVGLIDNYIAGIFVLSSAQSREIGIMLLDYVKEIKDNLSLNVYQKNIKAVKFYKKHNFVVENSCIGEDIEERELSMRWNK